MEIITQSVSGVIILKLQGELDSTTSPRVMACINDQILEGKVRIVADFEPVRSTSSAGLRMLLSAVKQTRARGGDIRLAAVQPNVLKVLNLSGFSKILKIYTDAGSAVDSFSPAQLS